jgi:transposase
MPLPSNWSCPTAAPCASVELTAGQFQMILDGIDLSRVRRFKRFSAPAS